MRILKFVGAFVGTFLIIFLIVFGFNLDALFTLFENSGDLQEGQEWVNRTTSLKGLTDYMGEHPDRVAVVSRSAANPDTTISYGSATPHTMGTLGNFFLIATYARLVEEGKINPDELISLEKVDRYQLPYIDASHHEDAVSSLYDREVVTGGGKIPLRVLAQTAITYNDLAMADYLYTKLGKEAISNTLQQLNLKQTDLPLPFSGLYITISPALQNTSFTARFGNLQSWPQKRLQDSVLAMTKKYLNDSPFRERVNNIFEKEKGLGIGFSERRDALSLFPQSTAGEMSQLMVQLQQDKLFSPAVSNRIKEIMEHPYEKQNLISDFKFYGAIYDNRLGLLNGIDYGASVYSGEPFGQAVFFDSMQVALWFHMSSTLMYQDYQQRLMWDPALRTATLQEINK